MYVYIQSEPQLWTVGFYDPQGNWHPETDHNTKDEAAKRAAWLNGDVGDLEDRLSSLEIRHNNLCLNANLCDY